ncbi:MAG: hypothetical protein EPN72_04295 [Nevskiaceae bacterium]|nr:MAG: hypothetical protein EPN63_07075 [Nevskiaceae bacterium]TBR74032.1 MAG: hypothetical protein EPN72_04295 [Nevskiaceae bacterium]
MTMQTSFRPKTVSRFHTTSSRVARVLCCTLVVAALQGCATVTTLVEHHNLQVTTRMSSSLFMNPTAPADRSVFLQVQNTNDKGDFGLGPALAAVIQSRGWTLVTDPAKARVVLQIGVLQAGKMQVQSLQTALVGGYGSVLATAAVGAGIAAAAGGSGTAIGGTAIGLGTADYVGGLLVKPETFSVVADIRVLQRKDVPVPPPVVPTTPAPAPTPVTPENSGNAPAAPATPAPATSAVLSTPPPVPPALPPPASTPPAPTYATQQTRVVCFAERTNLTWNDAMPALRQGLVNTLAGLF